MLTKHEKNLDQTDNYTRTVELLRQVEIRLKPAEPTTPPRKNPIKHIFRIFFPQSPTL